MCQQLLPPHLNELKNQAEWSAVLLIPKFSLSAGDELIAEKRQNQSCCTASKDNMCKKMSAAAFHLQMPSSLAVSVEGT